MTYPRVTTNDDAGQSSTGGVPSNPRFPEIEQRVLKYWDEDGTFIASVEGRDAGTDGDNEFVFYDGPPFANGLPHYGHLLTGYVKDIVPVLQHALLDLGEARVGGDAGTRGGVAGRVAGLVAGRGDLGIGHARGLLASRLWVVRHVHEDDVS